MSKPRSSLISRLYFETMPHMMAVVGARTHNTESMPVRTCLRVDISCPPPSPPTHRTPPRPPAMANDLMGARAMIIAQQRTADPRAGF